MKIYKFSRRNLDTKFGNFQAKGLKDIERTTNSLTFDRMTNREHLYVLKTFTGTVPIFAIFKQRDLKILVERRTLGLQTS